MSEGSLLIFGKRGRGRPRASDEPMERIDVRIPVSDYEKIIALALERKESVASLTRAMLKVRVGEFRR